MSANEKLYDDRCPQHDLLCGDEKCVCQQIRDQFGISREQMNERRKLPLPKSDQVE